MEIKHESFGDVMKDHNDMIEDLADKDFEDESNDAI